MKSKLLSKCLVAAMLWAPALVAGTANAVDLRSWDRKINDVTKRFVVLTALGNQAVLDMETRLVWERTPAPVIQQWWNASQNICGVKSVGGRKGWRLPSLFEFMTLIDPSTTTGTSLPVGHPFAGIQPNDVFWTTTVSSASSVDGVVAVIVGGTYQAVAFPRTSYSARPWCVRGPSSPGPY